MSLQHLAREGDTLHLVNVIPLDATYSAFNFSPLNIAVSAGDMPVLDPELRTLSAIIRLLDGLDLPARTRAVCWLTSRFGQEGPG